MDNNQLFALICAVAPNPTDHEIEMGFKRDKMNNPYNESHKPKLRDRMEIIVDYKIAFGKMLRNKIL